MSPGGKGAERHFMDGEWERVFGQGRALSRLVVNESHRIGAEGWWEKVVILAPDRSRERRNCCIFFSVGSDVKSCSKTKQQQE